MLDLFDPVFLRKLQVLQLNSRKASLQGMYGEILTSKRGSSLEFREYKEYCFGDDFKHIDWNIYGRLEKLYVKTFRGEKSLSVYIFLDASRSMLLPRKDKKYDYALKTALALSYVALLNHNSLKLVVLSDRGADGGKRLFRESPFFYNSNDIFKVSRFLKDITPAGEANLAEGIKQILYKNRGMGTAIIISDFWVQVRNYQQAISFLRFKNFDINVLHIQGREETYPSLKIGQVKVRDIETQEQRIVALNEINRQQYVEAVKEHQSELHKFCLSNRACYARASTDFRVEDFILQELPKMKLLR